MTINRVYYFIRSIFQNVKLNRMKCINNKRKYNMITVKNSNHNMIIKRKYSSDYVSPKSNGPNKDPNDYTMVLYVIGMYIVSKLNNNNNK